MHGGRYVRCLTLGLLQSLISSSAVFPYWIQDEGCRPLQPGDSRSTSVAIDSLEFAEDAALTPEMRTRLVDEIKHRHFHASSSADADWQRELEQEIRTPFQEQGYFRVLVDLTSGLIRAELHRLHYWVAVHIESGPQYRLGEVRFENALGFTNQVLRPEIPLQERDLFNVSSVRQGLRRITSMYGRYGYVDATIEPRFDIDDESHRIDMTLKVDVGAQYTVGTLTIHGLDAPSEKLLRSKLEVGGVFDGTAVNEFFETNRASLPSGITAENGVTIGRDSANHTVNIVFEHRVCATP